MCKGALFIEDQPCEINFFVRASFVAGRPSSANLPSMVAEAAEFQTEPASGPHDVSDEREAWLCPHENTRWRDNDR